MTALQVAAVQQRLMVAALSCNAISRYNRFVMSYRRELQASDAALKSFFVRMSGGLSEYHAFKTRLANQSSLRSIGEGSYCDEAMATFDDALRSRGQSLADFVSSQRVAIDIRYGRCRAEAGESTRVAEAATTDEANSLVSTESEDSDSNATGGAPIAPAHHIWAARASAR